MEKLHLIPRFEDGLMFSKRDIRRLLMPVVAETLLSYLIGLADSVMVASAGEAAVSAVSLVDSVSLLFINLFMGLASGGAVVCGQYLGKGEEKTARNAAEQMVVIMLVLSAAVTALLMIFKTQVIQVLFGNAGSEVTDKCGIYYRIVMLSVPFIALYNAGAALFRTTGDSATPLKISVGMNVLNVAGNALLIYGFGMGVAGAAIPTLISRGIAMAVVLILAMNKDFRLHLGHIASYRPDRKLISDVLSIGVPNSLENGMFQFGKLILMTLAATRPLPEITANAIGNAMTALHCVVGISVNVTMTAVVSRCVGAGDYRQARWYTNYLIRYTVVYQGIVNILFLLTNSFILRLYGVSGETSYYAMQILVIHGVASIFLWPVAFMFNAAMRAAGDSTYAMVIATISMWLCRVAGSYVMIRGFGMNVVAIWIAWIIDWIFRTAFFVPRYLGGKWETKAVV